MIYQTKEYMEFQAWHDGAEIITAGGMPLLLKDGLAYTPNNSYGGPTKDFCPFDFINDLKAAGAKEYLIRFSPWRINHRHFPSNKREFSRHTVARDLTIPIKWGHGTKSSIKKNIDSGCQCSHITGKSVIAYYIIWFRSLYLETMERNNSEDCYKYSFEYFEKMFELFPENIDLFIVRTSGVNRNNSWIAAAIFLHDKYTAHYQFSGMDIEYAHLYPMERLISEACHYYQKQNKHLIHFGGGLTEDDSLHRFKKKWGNLELEYWTARGSI